jgi:DNA-binding transcriptional LysR family regulator
MRFKGLDLNLLVVLDALLATRNVSFAGRTLNLSQSATSGALAPLRDYFEDELLVQKGRSMVPTDLGTSLQPLVRSALMQIEGTIIERPGFDPAIESRDIRIIASDYVMMAWLAPILAELGQSAPNLRFEIATPEKDPVHALETGTADLLLMPEKYLSRDHPSTPCFEDTYCVIACQHNTAIGESLDPETFFALGHVDAAFPSLAPGYSDWFMRQSGRERRIELRAGSFTILPSFVVGTNRIAVVHRRLAEQFITHMPLRLLETPVSIPNIVESLQWHRHAEDNECLKWVRQKILAGSSIDAPDS